MDEFRVSDVEVYLPISSQIGVVPSNCRSRLVLSKFFALSTSKSVIPVHSLILK